MEGNEKERYFSVPVKAGKRTYFFDVKKTKNGELYLNITESKKIFDGNNGTFYFDKHTIFLYKEDYNKFLRGLETVIQCAETGIIPEIVEEEREINEIEKLEKEFDKED